MKFPYIMRKLLLALLSLSLAATVHAKEYGTYELKRLLTETASPAGKKYSLDGAYLDTILNDLGSHARNYPSRFDSAEDRQRAIQDVKAIAAMLEILINVPKPDKEILARAAYLASLGHNLDIPGAAQKANELYKKLLSMVPGDARSNYMYGTFLAGAGKAKESLPYLEKALSLGINDAAYAIGMAHLALGDKEQALKSLEDFKQRKPGDERLDKLIEGIRSGKIEVKKGEKGAG